MYSVYVKKKCSVKDKLSVFIILTQPVVLGTIRDVDTGGTVLWINSAYIGYYRNLFTHFFQRYCKY